MKLHKGKVKILLSFLVILLIIVTSFCSFAPPNPSTTKLDISANSITRIDAENLLSSAYFQWQYGSFNNLKPVAAVVSGTNVRLYLVKFNQSTGYGFSDSSTYYINQVSTDSPVARMWLTSEGFYMQYTGGSTTADLSSIIFYTDSQGDLVINDSFAFATGGNDNDTIADVAALWYDYYSLITNYESDLEEAESRGQSEGESIGYQEGYVDGFDTGMDYGYQFGYESGVVSGREEGYAHGYQAGEANGYEEGYSLGYDDGYAAAEPGDGEVVTEIVYLNPVELNVGKIFSGVSSMPQNLIGSAFGFELFGINIAGLLTTLIVLAVGGFIVGLFFKKR